MGKHEKPGVAWVIDGQWWGNYGPESRSLLEYGVFLSRESAQAEADRLNEKERKFYENRHSGDMWEYFAEEYDLYE